jgi:RNA polymerase sigma-70 factor, ECF subfamily
MTDEELVTAFLAAKDEGAFRQIVERNAGNVMRLVSSILGPFRDLDAEETAQEVFVRAYQRLPQFRGESRFSTWLYRLAFNVAINRSKTARFRIPHVAIDALSMQVDGTADPHGAASASERATILAAAIETLPDIYRTAVYLHYWQEQSVEEIALLIGVAPNTVKSYLFRARERLSRLLGAKGVTS